MSPEEEGGAPDTQAGSHPFQLTTTLASNTNTVPIEGYVDSGIREIRPEVQPLDFTKDLRFNLPPGLVGNPTPLPKCTMYVFIQETTDHGEGCPLDTIVGVATPITSNVNKTLQVPLAYSTPLYSLEPSVGEPAKFGFGATRRL